MQIAKPMLLKKFGAMTPDELSKFCIDNAGKDASGEDKDGKMHSGRILAYLASNSGGWIVLEDNKLGKKKLPSPLPTIPFLDNKWYCVVTDCHLGVACRAGSVKIAGTPNLSNSIPPQNITAQAPSKASVKAPRPCGHNECHIDWCWKKYIGLA